MGLKRRTNVGPSVIQEPQGLEGWARSIAPTTKRERDPECDSLRDHPRPHALVERHF